MSTDQKKDIIQPHARGEYDKLLHYYKGLTREGIDALNKTEKGIYSDCFLLHTRNLIDFLCNNRVFVPRCKNCEKHEECEEKDKQKKMMMF